MQKRLVLVCEGSLCPIKLPEVSRPGLEEAGRYTLALNHALIWGYGYPVPIKLTMAKHAKTIIIKEHRLDGSKERATSPQVVTTTSS